MADVAFVRRINGGKAHRLEPGTHHLACNAAEFVFVGFGYEAVLDPDYVAEGRCRRCFPPPARERRGTV